MVSQVPTGARGRLGTRTRRSRRLPGDSVITGYVGRSGEQSPAWGARHPDPGGPSENHPPRHGKQMRREKSKESQGVTSWHATQFPG